ncbi:ser thr protein phosphatase family [Ophiostoma piceae UAMH 11346]|uniref:Ser thr protein phosphatase family n=1 Tax=Ophiostoma piceae (strain UAMH 11346) TaxID=1262450 RepID=S3CNB2_OPHP1|nr:ser thr protein phosphatase family [Ophiostoma piceae UAMH 11346]
MSRIMLPFIGRVRRRRMIMLVALLLIFMLYLRSSSQYATSQPQESKFFPASSPEDEMAALEKSPVTAQPHHAPAPAPGDESIQGPDTASDTPVIHKAPVPVSPNDQLAHPPANDAASKDMASTPQAGARVGAGPAAGASENFAPEANNAPTQQPGTDDQWQTTPPQEPEEDENAAPQIEASEVPPNTKTVIVGGKKYIDPGARPMISMEYGTTARPPVQGLTKLVEEMPVELMVNDVNDINDKESTASAASLARKPLRRRRFVFVGDVHGQRKSLDELLEKINFETGHDHLVLVGDLINKGPDSAGVVQLAMDLGASAVRGNHEDRVLAAYDSIHAANSYSPKPWQSVASATSGQVKKRMSLSEIEAEGKMERASAMLQREEDLKAEDAAKKKGLLTLIGIRKEQKNEEDVIDHDKMVEELDVDPLEQNPFPHGDTPERKTAASLSPEQAAWLSELPVILHVGKIAPSPSAVSTQVQEENARFPFNDVVVAHAGLVPDLPLERQDPYAVMVMRSLVHPADEVRQERARLVAEIRIRAESRGRIQANQYVDVPQHRAEAEFHKMQKAVYGPDPHHPHRSSPPGSPKKMAGGNPSPADLVLLPIEGHFREGHDRMHWAAAWNQAQHEKLSLENRTTVIYGHDAITGLLVPEVVPSGIMSLFSAGGNGVKSGSVTTATDTGYTFGLDSGAVYGGKLTALIIEADKTGRVKYGIEQVQCPAAAKKKFAD